MILSIKKRKKTQKRRVFRTGKVRHGALGIAEAGAADEDDVLLATDGAVLCEHGGVVVLEGVVAAAATASPLQDKKRKEKKRKEKKRKDNSRQTGRSIGVSFIP